MPEAGPTDEPATPTVPSGLNADQGTKVWFYVVDGVRRGPVGAGEVATLISGDHLPTDTPVWKAGMVDWLSASKIPEIAHLCAPPTPMLPRLLPTGTPPESSRTSGTVFGFGEGLRWLTHSWTIKRAGAGGLKDVFFVCAIGFAFTFGNLIVPIRPDWVILPIVGLALWRLWAIAGLRGGLLGRLWNSGLGEVFIWAMAGNLFWLALARALTRDPALGAPTFLRWSLLCWTLVSLVSLWRAAGKYAGSRPWLTRTLVSSGAWIWPLVFLLMRVDPSPGTGKAALNGSEARGTSPVRTGAAATVPADSAESALLEWADQGNVSAMESLGTLYFGGAGHPQDLERASLWYRKAADRGSIWGQVSIAGMYSKGQGVPQDWAQAAAWYRKAADQGSAIAQYYLGNAYYWGKGVSQDYGQAAAWTRKAADGGDPDAQRGLGNLYRGGRGVPRDSGQALAWYRKAADQGDAHAQHNVGMMYQLGEGVPRDDEQAAAWHRRAAEQGFADAQYGLGLMYSLGQGVPRDYEQAIMWFRKAAEQGHAEAQKALQRELRLLGR